MSNQQRFDHQTGLFRARDGAALFEQTWQPRRVSGVVALVHGVAEHSGRYARLAAELCAAGYALTAFDLRGHGRSEGLVLLCAPLTLTWTTSPHSSSGRAAAQEGSRSS